MLAGPAPRVPLRPLPGNEVRPGSPRCRSTTRTAPARSRTSPATGSTSPARSPPACARSPASPPGGRPSCWTPTGSPSRRGACPGSRAGTRLSDDGTLVATTSFVTGHTYATVGFSTLTEIHRADGTSLGNVEDFALTVDGAPFTAADRNIWGVTFVDDDTFYATAASQSAGTTWLVEGSVEDRTLTSVRDGAECPSVSPDRTEVAYKKVVDTVAGQPVWALAVLDLATGTESLLPATRGVDDQAEWLDDDTLLYGLSRADQPGTTDVWAVDTSPDATPTMLIPGHGRRRW